MLARRVGSPLWAEVWRLTRLQSSSGSIVPLILLLSLVWLIYYPGRTKAPEFDQLQYFAERQQWPTFEAAMDRLDYSLARRNWKGDEGEYRPLLFLLLSVEYALFGADMRGWHTISIGLHVWVTFQLFGLLALNLSRPNCLLLASLFAALFTNIPLVLDPYVGGYLAGAAMFLAAMRHAQSARQRDVNTLSGWLPYAGLMTLASFCFELFVILSIVLAGSIVADFRRRAVRLPVGLVVLLIAPAVIYCSFYLPRLFVAPRLFFVDGLPESDLLATKHLFDRVLAFPGTFIRVVTDVLLPTAAPAFSPAASAVVRIAFLVNLTLVVSNLPFIRLASTCIGGQALQRLWMSLFLLAVYVAVIQFGRGGFDPSHLYVVGLIMVLALAALLESPVTRRVWTTTTPLLVMMIAFNAGLLVRSAVRQGLEGAEFVQYLAALARFVTAHRSVPAFSFSVDSHAVDRALPIVEGYPDDPSHAGADALWQAFEGATTDSPSYRLVWNGKNLVHSAD